MVARHLSYLAAYRLPRYVDTGHCNRERSSIADHGTPRFSMSDRPDFTVGVT